MAAVVIPMLPCMAITAGMPASDNNGPIEASRPLSWVLDSGPVPALWHETRIASRGREPLSRTRLAKSAPDAIARRPFWSSSNNCASRDFSSKEP